MRRFWPALYLVVLMGWPALGLAQERRIPNRPEGPEEGTQIPPGLRIADLKIGPLYLQPRVTLSNVGWDSNITGRPDGAGKTSDFRASPGAGLKVAVPFRQQHMVTGDGQLDYLWYAETEQLRTFNGAALARYEYSSDRFEAEALGRYVDAQITQTDLTEIGDSTVPPEFEIFEAARQRTNLLSLQGTWHLSPQIFLRGRASRRLVRLEDLDPDRTTLSDELDRTEESVGVAVGYQMTPKTSFALVGDWMTYDYENPSSLRDAETNRVGVEIALDPTALLNGTVLLGYRDLTPREPSALGFEGFVVDGGLGVQPGGIASITLFGTRDAFPTFFGENVYYLRQGGGVSLLGQAARSFALGAELSVYEHDYPVPTAAPQADGSILTAERLDRIYNFLGRISWRQSGGSTLGFRVGWVNRTSNFDFANTDGLVIATSYALTY